MTNITFFFEDTNSLVINQSLIIQWLNLTAKEEGKTIESLSYILCSDEYLRNINVEYLQHDYYTDVITFDNSDDTNLIEGDIFISLDRIEDNAKEHSTTFIEELRRVMVHGLLHLLGYNDKSESEKLVMREKENAYLSLPQFQA